MGKGKNSSRGLTSTILFAYILLPAFSCGSPPIDVTGQAGGGETSGDSGSLTSSTPQHVICPNGWVRGTLSRQLFQESGRSSVCLYINHQPETWQNARSECHSRNSFLLTLEAVVSVENTLFHQYLADRGITDIWTGLHKEAGRQLWDDPEDGMARPYSGSDRNLGEAKRGWKWDLATFETANLTCGLFRFSSSRAGIERERRQTRDTSNSERQDKPSTPITNQRDVLPKRQRVPPEKSLESFKKFLSNQGLNKFADKMSDSPQGSDDAKGAKAANTTTDPISSDDDEPHDVTKRSTHMVPLHTTEDTPTTGNVSKSSEDIASSSSNSSSAVDANENIEVTTTASPVITSQLSGAPVQDVSTVPSNTSLKPNRTPALQDESVHDGNETSDTESSQKTLFNEEMLNRFKTGTVQPSSEQKYQMSEENTPIPVSEFIKRFQTKILNNASKSNDTSATTAPPKTEQISNQLGSSTDKTFPLSARDFIRRFQTGLLREVAAINHTSVGTTTARTESATAAPSLQKAPQLVLPGDIHRQTNTTGLPSTLTIDSSSEESTTESTSQDRDDITVSTPAQGLGIMPVASYDGPGFGQHFGPPRTDGDSLSPNDEQKALTTPPPLASKQVERATTESSPDILSEEYTPGTTPLVITDASLEDTLFENFTTTRPSTQPTAEKQYDETHKNSTTLAQLQEILTSITLSTGSVTEDHQTMGLHQCQERHPFVCAAKPVEKLAPAGQCERGWLGHSLLSRCYKPVHLRAEYHEASRLCELEGAKLAIVDSPFFANVTAVLVEMMDKLNGFGGSAWVDTTTNTATPPDGLCGVAEASSLSRRPCTNTLPFICQKLARNGMNLGDESSDVSLNTKIVLKNMTSSDSRSLFCPIQTASHDDVVVWYKDSKPIPPDTLDSALFVSTNSRIPGILELNVKLLRRLGMSERRLQPAMLQGMYWCRVWRLYPLQSLTSHRMFVRFRDVITLQGFVKSSAISMETAVFFNEMGHDGGLPATIANDLQLMNDRITETLRARHPYLSDIVTEAVHINPYTGETEFRTYLCLSTVGLPYSAKGVVVDSYLRRLHVELIANDDLVRQGWNLSLPFEEAFRIMMTEMCSETRLVDSSTGFEATFPSTPANQKAESQENCDGVFVGYAVCSGDLQSGAEWSNWTIDTACENGGDSVGDNEGDDRTKHDPVPGKDDGSVAPSKPNAALLEVNEVLIEQGNVADVSDHLAHILTSSGDLTDGDVGIVADVVDRITLVPSIPTDVGFQLLQSVSKVLDSPLHVLEKAQRISNASTRILNDLDLFGEKLDLNQDVHMRYVTPNVAMEVWQSQQLAGGPVIGFAATSAGSLAAPLSESRILTLRNRTWADLHIDEFDVAIALPDQLVLDTSSGVSRNVRLTMAIFRKAGLFLSSSSNLGSLGASQLNSAVISASIGRKKIENLRENVQLIFRPNMTNKHRFTRCVFWDFTLRAGGGWSQKGCIYNGTVRGRDICLCDHLTNFAVLLDFYGSSRPLDSGDDMALNIISMVGLSLSILGLALTIITFVFFKKLRQGRAQQTLFNVAVALFCTDTLLLVGFKQTTHDTICLLVAALLHYFILVSFAWMLIEAVLQYLTFVKVLGTYISKYTLKTVIPAWGAPVIPVIAVLSIDHRLYNGRQDYCWMELTAFYYAFVLPVGVIVLFNLVMFVVIMVSLVRRPEGLRSNRSKSQAMETNVKAAFTIFILLGLTWVFGFLTIAHARLTFQYVFTVLSSLQGFFIFMLLVVRRRQFREQWRVLCCRITGQPRNRQVTPTISNSTSSNSSGSSFSSANNSSTKTLRSFLNHGYVSGGGEESEYAGYSKTRSRLSSAAK